MRFGLRHAVEIQPRLDLVQATFEPFGIGTVDPGKAVERLRRAQISPVKTKFGLRARLR